MSSFRFSLQRVLDWRRAQLEMEEVRYRDRQSAVAALDRERAALEASGIQAEGQVRGWHTLAGSDLSALGAFRRSLRARQRQVAVRRAEAAKALAAQLKVMLEARRRCRLLERLRERREAEWRIAGDKALEDLAAESYLARWNGFDLRDTPRFPPARRSQT